MGKYGRQRDASRVRQLGRYRLASGKLKEELKPVVAAYAPYDPSKPIAAFLEVTRKQQTVAFRLFSMLAPTNRLAGCR
jgi:hypothetical protein